MTLRQLRPLNLGLRFVRSLSLDLYLTTAALGPHVPDLSARSRILAERLQPCRAISHRAHSQLGASLLIPSRRMLAAQRAAAGRAVIRSHPPLQPPPMALSITNTTTGPCPAAVYWQSNIHPWVRGHRRQNVRCFSVLLASACSTAPPAALTAGAASTPALVHDDRSTPGRILAAAGPLPAAGAVRHLARPPGARSARMRAHVAHGGAIAPDAGGAEDDPDGNGVPSSSGSGTTSDDEGGGAAGTNSAGTTSRGGSTSSSGVPRRKGGPKKRYRLDEYVLQLHPQYSRNVVQSFILQGKVRVGDKVVSKAGTPVVEGSDVVLDAEQPKYVCRAGLKMEKALSYFGIDVAGKVALDSGLSTGGFTDCLLQNGAVQVFGVDVGSNQVADKIRRDPRVVVMEKVNLRNLLPSQLPCKVDIVTLDLSFISVLKVIPAVVAVMQPDGAQLLVLIKPQFEAGRSQVSAGGVVRDPKVHAEVVERITRGIEEHGFACRGVTESPIKGDKGGNTEFLAHFVRLPAAGAPQPDAGATAAGAGAGAAAGVTEQNP